MTSKVIDSDGWLRTGDIAYFDQDGYLYIVDRLKEMIKYNGYQVITLNHPIILFRKMHKNLTFKNI